MIRGLRFASAVAEAGGSVPAGVGEKGRRPRCSGPVIDFITKTAELPQTLGQVRELGDIPRVAASRGAIGCGSVRLACASLKFRRSKA